MAGDLLAGPAADVVAAEEQQVGSPPPGPSCPPVRIPWPRFVASLPPAWSSS